jgi:8-oxo-dGTP pyrophosphatase MutT (NUDIX family)
VVGRRDDWRYRIARAVMRAVREVSAGGVIYRKHGLGIDIALIHVRNRWGLPKGHVEEGERSATRPSGRCRKRPV